jgi:hypothetical protein
MAIKGHKERALLRRGVHVQESLKRRVDVLNESALLRRLITEEEDLVKISKLCGDDVSNGIVDSVYCKLFNILNEIPSDLVGEIHKSIDDIYNFYRNRITTDNRTLFRKTIEVILRNENPGTAFKLVATYLLDSTIDIDEKISKLRSFIKVGGGIEEDALDDYLRQVRSIEYTNYENSFVGDNFDILRGYVKFSHGHDESAFHKIVAGVLTKKYTLDAVVKTITKVILSTPVEELVGKADLKLKVDLISDDDGEPVFYSGDPIEVKKMDYKTDSYFSEFFAIYKNPEYFSEFANNQQFRNVYNTIIDGVYVELKTKGDHLLDTIWNSVKGIVYENNRMVKMDDIELYWSNKGQRGCDDHRLTIRYRLNRSNVMSYLYNGSNRLRPEPINTNYSEDEKFCPIFSEELYQTISKS